MFNDDKQYIRYLPHNTYADTMGRLGKSGALSEG